MAYSPLSILPHNDIHLRDGSLADVRGSEAIGQNVRQRLKLFKREYWLDEAQGLDWFGYILGKDRAVQPIAESLIKLHILETPGVIEITEFLATYDQASRGLRVSRISIRTIYDEQVSITL